MPTPAQPHHRFVIIGAGPTGLGAALRLLELGETDFLLIEAAPTAGGLAASVVDERGFTWDLGGHVQFSHYQTFDDYMALALGEEGWIAHQRESWVWMRERFVPYPFQYNLHRLPKDDTWRCVQGLLEVAGAPVEKPTDFADWILRTFGRGIAEVFLLPYNFKVWAYPPSAMNARWVGERVAVPDLQTVIKGLCLGKDHLSWGPNNTFRFPRRGGTGAVWTQLAERIPSANTRFNDAVVAIDAANRTLTTASGIRCGYEHLISTLPLDRLAVMVGDPALIEETARLLYSSVHVVGIGLRGQPPAALRTKCWMYFPEDDCPFYRVTVFSNYSPNNTPEPGSTWSLMAEVSESPQKPVDAERVVEDVIRGMYATQLIQSDAEILTRWHRRLEYGYPTPSRERDAILEQTLPALEALNIYSRGRFGAWRYEVSNQDHSLMQGVEVVERLVKLRQEVTLNQSELVNGRYNPSPYPEWQ
ncbi:FAD-dependent oxidoreductase [uncultured Thiodictyon sp.]|uniref:protoporphyrinogen/coproporphyrinogen oxidase n=1 Tax=uncultured Thiodictyon sp. TaxID=1846217 RepID=UPI0025CC554E|nr:FAD-dependent oxidoreductase [uncultured Thiodictyon sp.]